MSLDGRHLVPMSSVVPQGHKAISGDIIFTWKRRRSVFSVASWVAISML